MRFELARRIHAFIEAREAAKGEAEAEGAEAEADPVEHSRA